MDHGSRAAKEEVIHAVEAEIKGNLASGWISLGGASILTAIGITTYEWYRASNPNGWIQLVVELPIALFMLGTSLIAWRSVARQRTVLVQLKEILAQETAGQHLGIWPPPPRAAD